MSGGTWTNQNKVRPGVYINFKSEAQPLGTAGERGVAAMAMALSWGPVKQMIALQAGTNSFNVLGYAMTAPQLLLIKEALKRARTVLIYRLNTGTKAGAVHGGLTVTAKYGGERGNDISVVVQTNIEDSTKFNVITLVDGTEVEMQTVASIEELHSNDWVDFSGTGSLTVTAGSALTGGSDGTAANQDHVDFLAAAELHDFHTLALISNESSLKSLYTAFVKRLRDEEGKKVQAVMPDYSDADYEGVISVKNGVVLSDGTTLTAAEACAWTAGAAAGADMNESLTYQSYDDAVDVSPRYTNSQIEASLKSGHFVFTPNGGRVIVEQDINTLTSYSPSKGKSFGKNRVIRVLDGINNDFVQIFSDFYVGNVSNNAEGRNLLKGECINYLEQLQGREAIQNFNAQTDISVTAGADAETVLIEAYIQPVDAVEKIYVAVTAQ